MSLFDPTDTLPEDQELRNLLENPSLEYERQFLEDLWTRYQPSIELIPAGSGAI